jgi:hypothetical protein
MPKHAKRSNRSGSSRSGAAVTAALSLSQVWDLKLARSKDSCHVRDRVPVGVIGATTGLASSLTPVSIANTNGSSTTPGIFGNRVYAIGTNYARYRVNRLLATYRPIVGTTTAGIVGIGFLDDATATFTNEGTVGYIEELRCSHNDSCYRDIEVEWKPIDSSIWYYVFPDVAATQTTADQRLEYPCSFATVVQYGVAGTISYGLSSLYFDITFEGAVNASNAP